MSYLWPYFRQYDGILIRIDEYLYLRFESDILLLKARQNLLFDDKSYSFRLSILFIFVIIFIVLCLSFSRSLQIEDIRSLL
jgi:hypothetical protein